MSKKNTTNLPFGARYLKHIILAFTLGIISFTSTNAQPGYLQFDKIEGGLNTLLVNAVFQDSRGWMWFGTSQGLLKYNGFRLELFKSKQDDDSELAGNEVRFIYEDSKGILWVGTDQGGVQYFDRTTFKFTGLHEQDALHRTIYYAANAMAEDKKGNLWIGTDQGLKKWDRSTGKFTSYTHNPLRENSLCNNTINKLHFGRDGRLWIGTKQGLDCYRTDDSGFEHIPLFKNKEEGQSVIEIYEDYEGKLWIGTYESGIAIIDPKTDNINYLIPGKKDEYSRTVRAIIQDKQGNFWIGTRDGLYIYSKTTNRFSLFTHDEKVPLSICHNSIFSFFQDNQDNIWIGTRSGISYLINEKQTFHHFNNNSNALQNLNDNDVNTFWSDAEKNIWIGTDLGGINILNPKNNSFRYITTRDGLSSNTIKAMVSDGRGNLWIGTYLGGICIYNLNTGNIAKTYKHDVLDEGSLSDNKVWCMFRDSKGSFWVGTAKGVDTFDNETKTFIHFRNQQINKDVDWIAEDADHDIWIGTNPTIYVYNSKNKSIRSFSIQTRTRAFLQDHNNRIWLTTASKGIVLIDKNTLTAEKFYTESNGIANNSTFSIVEDDQNTIWIGTANGLSMFFPDQGKFRSFSKDDGTRITTYNYNACYKLPSGELLLGGFNGFVSFDPENIKTNDFKPPVELTDFRIFNSSVPVGTKDSPLQKHISETKDIVLKHDQNFISFRYIALNYNSPGKNKYAYKLEGVDKDWNIVGDRREANYTNLEPGEYKFLVKASNNDDLWNETGVSVNLRIIPPFYKTWLFRISAVLLITLVTTIVVRRRMQYIQNQNRILEQLVYDKTKDLQQLAIELEESQSEVMAQNEEIEQQNETLTGLNERINQQNEALKHYNSDLETKVKERTAELEIAKTRAEESDKLKSSILTNMSHEIRTPMNSIVGLSNLLMDEDLNPEDKKFFTVNIRRNCDILLHLINDILDLSVIEAGKMSLHFNQVNINELLSDLHDIFNTDKQWLEKSHLDFHLNIPAVAVFTITDKVRLEQIIRNLLHNAFKFTNNGYIELGYKVTILDIIIYVKDTGVGIPNDKINSIFDRFVKLQDNNVKTDFGVGLGLAISSKLIQMLEGKIWVESEQNQGSTFFVSIPLRKESDVS